MSTTAALPQRPSKPPPVGPAPPAPGAVPPNPPGSNTGSATANGAKSTPTPNGTSKGKKTSSKQETPVDPQAMYESLKSKIAALEEELNHADEEESKFADEAQKSVRGMEDNAIQSKYLELFTEMKRIERDHAKEKQKLTKDKDTAKSQLTKANQTKAKLENFARDLTKDNKKLREEKQQLLQDVAKGLEEIKHLSAEITKGKEKARQQEMKNRDKPEIVVKVVCKYRAELFFKIPRKTKLSRLFTAWADRMETTSGRKGSVQANGVPIGSPAPKGANGSDAASIKSNASSHSAGTGAAANGASVALPLPPMTFVYTHHGRSLDPEMTIEEAGIEEADEILAVELMDLTGPMPDDAEELVEARGPKLKKNWTDNPQEAKRAMEEIFDGVTKERLKFVLRQYELRERHFECFVRSKELELLLARYREQEQKQLVEFERSRIDKLEEDNQQVRKELEDVHNGQTLLIEKLIQCCKEPNAERTQRLFTSLREELEKRGTKLVDGTAVG
ncbi:uncharacterized protein FOMMEDRAFT_136872 [Fomitiporia mediterranea MF3/22]|uniref:uncharacterized protein n=1 Tax=Fomitiporia mediterranea (strain MF3/22) TaxID=694068 RepID=UPI0004407885|nr:uncharacterized protein FOMMEDRAFT_136872 [Fomitiporia mediterranea MF3/22]EJC98655.1 hypothetical protein FOMMEDRAFT_136872 [Fomitiporia mediterranea MF3/22]